MCESGREGEAWRFPHFERGFLHLGNIIQIPQCWIFDDAGKGKTEGWRSSEEKWGERKDMGRETRRGRCSLTMWP